MEEKKEQVKKEENVHTNKNRTIPKADVEMMREDLYEQSMTSEYRKYR